MKRRSCHLSVSLLNIEEGMFTFSWSKAYLQMLMAEDPCFSSNTLLLSVSAELSSEGAPVSPTDSNSLEQFFLI